MHSVKFLGFVYMSAGCALTMLLLRIVDRNWDELGEITIYTAVPNALTALLAYPMLRKSARRLNAHFILLVSCYVIGIGGGIYFYFW